MTIPAWLQFALLSTIIAAVLHLIDIYLRTDGVFEDPMEPTVVSGAMQTMPRLALPILTLCDGLLHVASRFFYFTALFSFDDDVHATRLGNLGELRVFYRTDLGLRFVERDVPLLAQQGWLAPPPKARSRKAA
jgi:hypothetical protein